MRSLPRSRVLREEDHRHERLERCAPTDDPDGATGPGCRIWVDDEPIRIAKCLVRRGRRQPMLGDVVAAMPPIGPFSHGLSVLRVQYNPRRSFPLGPAMRSYTAAMEAARDVAGLDQLDPAMSPARDAVHFRRIVAARQGIAAAEQELRDAVKAARDAGDSWTVTASALDTTRQAAQQRFGGI